MELHRIRLKCRSVEHVKFHRECPIAELRAEQVARRQERLPRAVARIAGEALVVADDAANLSALVVAPEARPSGHADDAIKRDTALHQDVEDAGREQPAHRPSFKYKPAFQCSSLQEF